MLSETGESGSPMSSKAELETKTEAKSLALSSEDAIVGYRRLAPIPSLVGDFL